MKSPLKGKPLRNPGQSLEEQLQEIHDNQIVLNSIVGALCVSFAGFEWWRWYFDIGPSPWLFSVLALVAVVISALKVWRGLGIKRNIVLGRDGEKAVGQFLEGLRESGARVFHDIPGDGFNLDHVVIHESGIYVIETKTLSKPDRGECKLIYNGEEILKHGLKPDRNPITQVRAARRWLSELIEEFTGRTFPVRGVVVYPGWYIEPTVEAKSSDVWVLNPKALPAFIAQSATQLRAEDVKLCSNQVGRYVRGLH